MLDSRGVTKIIVETGNVLNLNDIVKKPGQKSTDELLECLKLALTNCKKAKKSHELEVTSKEPVYTHDVDTNELLISVKLFVDFGEAQILEEALQKCLNYLETKCINSLVLSYKPKGNDVELHEVWNILENFALENKICRIGIADLDTDQFIAFYERVQVKPSIVQISLSSCCVVPPALQEFAKLHDIQLLTHNDPQEILPEEKLREIIPDVEPKKVWVTRFQAHYKCRGVLATKGYILGICL
uniref:GCS light chain n=1 Tax=Panstrongylus lignarius TaxID=156445 RepID=A0A224XIV8_9HEMI